MSCSSEDSESFFLSLDFFEFFLVFLVFFLDFREVFSSSESEELGDELEPDPESESESESEAEGERNGAEELDDDDVALPYRMKPANRRRAPETQDNAAARWFDAAIDAAEAGDLD